MMGEENIKGKVVGLFLFGCVLFSYPVLTLFNVKVFVLGIPLLFLYYFLAWFGFILLIFAFSHTHLRPGRDDSAPSPRQPHTGA